MLAWPACWDAVGHVFCCLLTLLPHPTRCRPCVPSRWAGRGLPGQLDVLRGLLCALVCYVSRSLLEPLTPTGSAKPGYIAERRVL